MVLQLAGMVATEDAPGVETGREMSTGEDTIIRELEADQDRGRHKN